MPDSNVMVRALVVWHDHHRESAAELRRRLLGGEPMFLAGHALLETYSVMTRAPAPYRLAPDVVVAAIRSNYLEKGTVVPLRPEDYIDVLASLPGKGVAGGRTYDALIARCAEIAGVGTLLTFNVRDFAGLVPGLEIVAPGPLTGSTGH